MAEAYIYDAVRTPRGKGKSSGSLHEITSAAARDTGAEGTEGARTISTRPRSMT